MDEIIISGKNNSTAFQPIGSIGENNSSFFRDYKIKKETNIPCIYPYIKRFLDFIISFFGLLLSSPLWVIIIIAIKIESKGSAFYFQERCGKDGSVFKQFKFRSMVKDAEKITGPVLASDEDPRITRVGKFLRKTALDELPQILNILLGDMSFVGPRPERPCIMEKDILDKVPNFDKRHVIRPGLTGLAQVFGRYNTLPRNKLRYDLIYISNYSLLLDVKLFVLSFWITFQGKWQHKGKRL